MKNPAPPTEVWSPLHRERGETPSSKKFKRKSREPKRLLSTAAPPLDLSDVDSSEDTLMGTRYVSKLAPLHRQLMVSKDMSEEAGAQSRALDMRTCSNGPVLGAKAPPFSLSTQEISHWPPSISQPLSGRLKLGPPSSFPAGSGFPHQVFPMEPSPPRQPGVRTHPSPPSPQCLDHIEAPLLSPKESPRKRTGIDADQRGPEVKAIQQTRRLLANARERTRVHTISAAFEALRKQVPCYSYGQKLSKLAILRIACNYILSLAQLAELHPGSDRSGFSECVDQCTRTLQAEGRSKKRKE
ncbi:atonal-like protein 8 [Oryzias melastigma]|uniref:Protein atonal homolog 8 n=1 Tax=Oryzias melastigma TaxID=30732 RepID=A0A3B3BYH0_ORYME|nr:protein atonal homolog 8 [Oryzias melastigma]KAF6737373.1 atonal-like protein 8 [Oryzias melastigma]